MPLTQKGEEIKRNMEKEYGPEKGERVFYASRNKGTISGVDHADSTSGGAGDAIHGYLDAASRGDSDSMIEHAKRFDRG